MINKIVTVNTTKEAFLKMAEGFKVTKTIVGDTTTIKSPLEEIIITPTIRMNGKEGKEVTRKLVVDGYIYTTTTIVSKKYQIVTDSEIIEAIFKSPYLKNLVESMTKVVYNVYGGFDFIMNELHSDKEVLDYNKTYTRNVFGTYAKSIRFENSYNKSRAIRISTGIVRKETGITLISGYSSERIKHYTWNAERINENINKMLESVPEIVANNDFNDLYNEKFTDTKKINTTNMVEEYLNNKLTTKTVTENSDYAETVVTFKKTIVQGISQMFNRLDWVNIISTFKATSDTFGKSLSTVIENRYNKANPKKIDLNTSEIDSIANAFLNA